MDALCGCSGYRAVFERCKEGIFFCTPGGKLLDANGALIEMLGYKTKEGLFRAEDGGRLLITLWQYSNRESETVYLKQVKDDGLVLYFEADAWVASGPGEELYYGCVVINGIVPAGSPCKPALSVSEKSDQRKLAEHLDDRDPLTGVYSRMHFDREMLKLEKTSAQVSLILLDIDGLKIINDTMGREWGNRLLCAAAELIQTCVPHDALVARVGGDEFAVLLKDYPEEITREICASIRSGVRKLNQGRRQLLPLSISAGSAVRRNNTISMDELFRQADNNMNRDKLHSEQSRRSSIVHVLKKIMEARDFITESHSERIKNLAAAVGRDLEIPEEMVSDLKLLAQFHDIGKVGISDSILFKPGPLTPEEFKEMQRHCEIGYRIALSSPDLAPIADLILKHHEWWNGQGYPLGLKGKDIPLECRILAVVDAYDSMTSDRPYRKAVSKEAALAELEVFSGSQFDPEVFASFMRVIDRL